MMRKNRFLSFIFGMLPGAGQMYLGYMKRGVSLMTLFWGVSALATFFRMEPVLMIMPIIWFYAFFDTLNLSNQPYGEAYPDQDDFLFHLDGLLGKDWNIFMQKRHLIGGILCIVLGFYLITENIIAPIFEHYDIYIGQFLNAIPSALIAVAIIALGLRLLKGEHSSRPRPSSLEDDLKEYGQTPSSSSDDQQE